MKRILQKLTRSLTGRLTILFILVHLVTVIGLSSYQRLSYIKQTESSETPLYLILSTLSITLAENPGLNPSHIGRLGNAEDHDVKIWADLIKENPNLWYHFERDGQIHSYGQAPVFLPTLTSDISPLPNLEDVCLNGISEAYRGPHFVIAGYENCKTGLYKYELGGIEPNYNLPREPWSVVYFGEGFGLGPALLSYAGLILLMPFLIYGLVSPIRRASSAALKISPYSSRKTLPVDGMLSEVKGLADATNKALQKLDAGYVRERWLRDVLAHELRTPLTVMRGHIADVENAAVQKTLVEDLYRTDRVIERINNFSIATSLTSFPESLNLVEVVRAACAEAGSYGARRNVEINMIAESDRPKFVKVNRIALMLILTNLIGNAIRHSETSKAVDVEVFPHGEIQIRDDGKGMDIAALNKFFNNFSTLEDRLAQRKGLGLIIVAELIEFSASTIHAFETKGGGVGLSLQLPGAG